MPVEDDNTTKQNLREQYGREELKTQSEMWDHIDTKAGVILGFALVAVVEILGLLLLAITEKSQPHALGAHKGYLLVTIIGGIFLVLFSVVLCSFQLHPMNFEYVDLDFLKEIEGEATLDELKRRIEAKIEDCARRNSETIELKNKLATAASVCAGISIVLFAIGVVITLLVVLG